MFHDQIEDSAVDSYEETTFQKSKILLTSLEFHAEGVIFIEYKCSTCKKKLDFLYIHLNITLRQKEGRKLKNYRMKVQKKLDTFFFINNIAYYM